MGHYTLVLRLVDQCAHLGAFCKRVTDLDRFGTGLQAFEEGFVQRVGNQYATGGRTHLPGIEETAATGQLHGEVEVGVFKHQQGRLAAQLQAHALDRFGGALHDLDTHGIAASEGNLGNTRVGRHRRSHGQPGTADQVEHALGQAALGNDRGQFQLRQWRDFRRLEHHAATGSQCRCQLPGGGDHGEVPRHDQADHTARFAAQACTEVFARQRYGAVLPGIQPCCQFGVVVEGGDHVIDIDRRFEQWLAVVARLQFDQAFAACLDAGGDGAQVLSALGTRGTRPDGERLLRRRHRLLHRFTAGTGHLGQDLLGARVDHGQRLIAVLPGAVDVNTGQRVWKTQHAATAFIQVV
ncbi:hypothetical protein D3C85_1007900 [compost metagenome]